MIRMPLLLLPLTWIKWLQEQGNWNSDFRQPRVLHFPVTLPISCRYSTLSIAGLHGMLSQAVPEYTPVPHYAMQVHGRPLMFPLSQHNGCSNHLTFLM